MFLSANYYTKNLHTGSLDDVSSISSGSPRNEGSIRSRFFSPSLYSPDTSSPVRRHPLYKLLTPLKTTYLLNSKYVQPKNRVHADHYNSKISDDIMKTFQKIFDKQDLSDDFNSFLVTLSNFLNYPKDAYIEPCFLKDILNPNFEKIKDKLILDEDQKKMSLSQLIQSSLHQEIDTSSTYSSEKEDNENSLHPTIIQFQQLPMNDQSYLDTFIQLKRELEPSLNTIENLQPLITFFHYLDFYLNPYNKVDLNQLSYNLKNSKKIEIRPPHVEHHNFTKFEENLRQILNDQSFNLREFINTTLSKYNKLIPRDQGTRRALFTPTSSPLPGLELHRLHNGNPRGRHQFPSGNRSHFNTHDAGSGSGSEEDGVTTQPRFELTRVFTTTNRSFFKLNKKTFVILGSLTVCAYFLSRSLNSQPEQPQLFLPSPPTLSNPDEYTIVPFEQPVCPKIKLEDIEYIFNQVCTETEHEHQQRWFDYLRSIFGHVPDFLGKLWKMLNEPHPNPNFPFHEIHG